MSFESYTIVITGIGGQGLITLIEILGNSLVNNGYKVITSETHGLSQRGGKVVCFLRFGNKINAPIPIIGSADMIISLEKNCINDVLKFAKADKSTKLIIFSYDEGSTGKVISLNNSIINNISEFSDNIYFIPTNHIAEKFKFNMKVINMVLLGYILRFLPLNEEDLKTSLILKFSGDILKLNVKALNEGVTLEPYNIFKKD
ncbi:MAG: 2-oxoacid:acceptor oxidoreductase family protein [Candidatus Hodarchaeota archaeon]